MSTMPAMQPGLTHQAGARTVFRVLGALLFPTALVLLGWGFAEFVTMDLEAWDGGLPDGVLLFVGGMVLMPVGWLCLAAGFLGAAASYGAGETMPVLKQSYGYLTRDGGTTGWSDGRASG